MRVHYIYCHPLPESFHAAIRTQVLAGLEEAGHTVDLCDLYAEKFDPVMSAEERLNEIIALHEANGVFIANPHVYTLEDGTRHKSTGADQLGMKAEADPYGLLNPGKMRTYVPVKT